MTGAADVVVIGGGIVGACCAYELARDGACVVVVERRRGWGEGCSWGNAGLIVPSHAAPIASPANLRAGLGWMLRRDSPFGLRVRPALAGWLARYVRASSPRRFAAAEALQRNLSVESLRRLLTLDAELDLGVRQDGVLTVFDGPDAAAHAAAEAASASGRALGARVLCTEEVLRIEPALGSRVGAAVLHPHEAHCDPVRVVRGIGGAATAGGATLRTGVEAYGLAVDGSSVTVRTTHGKLRAATLVIAAGAWSGVLARSLGVRLPLQGGTGYAIELGAGALSLRRPVYLHDPRCVATPLVDRVRITGGLVLDGLDERFDERRIRAIRRAVVDAFGVDAPPRRVWRGLRPCTPDGLPVIGPSEVAGERVHFATGHGMLGLTLGPLTGRAIADAVAGRALPHALAALAADRFR